VEVKPLLTIEKVENYGPISINKDSIELMPLTIFIGANNTGKSLIAKLLGTLVLYKGVHKSKIPWFKLEEINDLKFNISFFIAGLTTPASLVKYGSNRLEIVISDDYNSRLKVEIAFENEFRGHYYAIPFHEIIELIREQSSRIVKLNGDLHKGEYEVIYVPPGKALIPAFVTAPFTIHTMFIDSIREGWRNFDNFIKVAIKDEQTRQFAELAFRTFEANLCKEFLEKLTAEQIAEHIKSKSYHIRRDFRRASPCFNRPLLIWVFIFNLF